MFGTLTGRVLSVCPSEHVRNERSELLQSQGYEVISCEKPAQAQPLAMMERFSAAIIGPGYDLREISETIRWIRHKGIPILFIREGPQPRVAADAFLPSDHDEEQLIRVVGWLAWT